MAVSDVAMKIITIVVMTIVITQVAIPIIDDMTDGSEIDFKNSGSYYVKQASGTTTIAYASSVLTIDGVQIDPVDTTARMPFLASDIAFSSVYTPTGAAMLLYYDTVNSTRKFVDNITAFTMTVNASTKTIAVADVAVSSGTAPDDFSVTYTTSCWVMSSAKTNYTAYAASAAVPLNYVNDVNDIYLVSSDSTGIYSVYGDVKTSTTGSVDNIELKSTLTPESGVSDVYSFKLTNNNSTSDIHIEKSGTAVTNQICVLPISVTGVDTDQDNLYDLIGVIPILLIMAIVMVAVAMIRAKS